MPIMTNFPFFRMLLGDIDSLRTSLETLLLHVTTSSVVDAIFPLAQETPQALVQSLAVVSHTDNYHILTIPQVETHSPSLTLASVTSHETHSLLFGLTTTTQTVIT